MIAHPTLRLVPAFALFLCGCCASLTTRVEIFGKPELLKSVNGAATRAQIERKAFDIRNAVQDTTKQVARSATAAQNAADNLAAAADAAKKAAETANAEAVKKLRQYADAWNTYIQAEASLKGASNANTKNAVVAAAQTIKSLDPNTDSGAQLLYNLANCLPSTQRQTLQDTYGDLCVTAAACDKAGYEPPNARDLTALGEALAGLDTTKCQPSPATVYATLANVANEIATQCGGIAVSTTGKGALAAATKAVIDATTEVQNSKTSDEVQNSKTPATFDVAMVHLVHDKAPHYLAQLEAAKTTLDEQQATLKTLLTGIHDGGVTPDANAVGTNLTALQEMLQGKQVGNALIKVDSKEPFDLVDPNLVIITQNEDAWHSHAAVDGLSSKGNGGELQSVIVQEGPANYKLKQFHNDPKSGFELAMSIAEVGLSVLNTVVMNGRLPLAQKKQCDEIEGSDTTSADSKSPITPERAALLVSEFRTQRAQLLAKLRAQLALLSRTPPAPRPPNQPKAAASPPATDAATVVGILRGYDAAFSGILDCITGGCKTDDTTKGTAEGTTTTTTKVTITTSIATEPSSTASTTTTAPPPPPANKPNAPPAAPAAPATAQGSGAQSAPPTSQEGK